MKGGIEIKRIKNEFYALFFDATPEKWFLRPTNSIRQQQQQQKNDDGDPRWNKAQHK